MLLSVFLLALSVGANATPRTAEEALGAMHDEALKQLIDGNKRYVESKMNTCHESTAQLRTELAKGQKPFAIILSCSDSRVPPEIIFDKTLGELFVIRVAGNVVDPIILGSIEYAVEHLKTSLIVVLGHEKCGAVTAACQLKVKVKESKESKESRGYENSERKEGHASAEHGFDNISAILSQISPAVATVRRSSNKKDAEFVEEAIDENVRLVATNLRRRSKIIAEEVKIGKVRIVQAKYDLDDGQVTFFNNPVAPVVHEIATKHHTP